MNARDIIIAPVITEKSVAAMGDKKYTFRVADGSNKIEIAKAVEEIFGVKVTKVNTAYDPAFGNVSVTMVIEGRESKPILCYRLKGEGAETLAVGDTITVTGVFTNYKGTIEFDQGCVMVPNELYHSVKNALSGYKLLDGESFGTLFLGGKKQ